MESLRLEKTFDHLVWPMGIAESQKETFYRIFAWCLVEFTGYCRVKWLFGQSPPWPYSQDRNLAIAQWFLKSVSVKKELQIIAVSVHGLLQLFILLRAALKTPQMLTLFRGCTEHANMREWSLTECKFFYWLEAYFCRCHVWGKKKVVNETLKHAKYCREAYQWSIYRLKKK